MAISCPVLLRLSKPISAANLDKKFDNKTTIVGIVEKKKGVGRVKAFTTKQADATVTLPFLRASIEVGSVLHTDDSRIYSRVKRDFSHEFVNHSKLEYVRSGVHTNTIEGFWGQLKRSLGGTYHCVSPKYLQYYVNEFVFRYNHRQVAAFADFFIRLLRHVHILSREDMSET